MSAPLDDITIYYWGEKLKDSDGFSYQIPANYIADFYHQMLFGYKPPKTGRICISIAQEYTFSGPTYCGSICQVTEYFDEDKFLTYSKREQYEDLLNIVHISCMKCAELLNWDKDVFLYAYREVRKRNFCFYLDYPLKEARDRRRSAFVRIEKTEKSSILYLNFMEKTGIKTVRLFEKVNWFWYDPIYDLAKNSQWLDLNTFGVHSKKHNKHSYYSLVDDVIIGNVKQNITGSQV